MRISGSSADGDQDRPKVKEKGKRVSFEKEETMRRGNARRGGDQRSKDSPSRRGTESMSNTAQNPIGATPLTSIFTRSSAAFLFSPTPYASRKSRYIGKKLSLLARTENVGLESEASW